MTSWGHCKDFLGWEWESWVGSASPLRPDARVPLAALLENYSVMTSFSPTQPASALGPKTNNSGKVPSLPSLSDLRQPVAQSSGANHYNQEFIENNTEQNVQADYAILW